MQRNVNDEELAASMRRALRDFALACTASLPLHVTLHAAVPPQDAAGARHVRCSQLIGGRVSSTPGADGKRTDLGTAHDFLVDGGTGRVTHVIVRSGGLAGIG